MFIGPFVTAQMRDDVWDWVGHCLKSGTHQRLTEGRSGNWLGPIWPIKGYWHFDQRSPCPSLMTFSNTQMEYVVDLLRLHSRSSWQHRVALFSKVLELHKSKVYRFSYLDFCTTQIYYLRRITFFCPCNSLDVNSLATFRQPGVYRRRRNFLSSHWIWHIWLKLA